MEGIQHRMVNVNGITMHVAEKGQGGPTILFLHGFPEVWYSWRHQILALSSLGYHTIAPDLRGYGDTESPISVTSYTYMQIVGDLVALIDSLGEDQVFLVGHDWGSIIGWYLCLFRPDRIKAFFCLSIPFMPRKPKMKPLESMRLFYGEDYYICRFQEPGKMEEEIAHYGTSEVLKSIITSRQSGPPRLPKDNPFGIKPDAPIKLPSWFSEEDLSYYANKFNQKGFTGPLNYYRAFDLNWEMTAPWTNVQVKVPVKFITGDLDCVYTTPGVKEYIQSDAFKRDVPLLDEVVVMEGVGHFINQEKAEEISSSIYDFIKKF
ncbi:Epoxide hydrolase-like protein [Corchorus olitorius]|uniref:soluble epoxide hydrolase n=1 Tax=Corchorus olitorius TaxID=93759 RepID=A0A1R3K850_9ROSI|nr:Epoxide hydrolase-like protein [Corchorus olitorius]